jgi:hypothetical protein
MSAAPVVRCLKRVTDLDGKTINFMIPSGDRRRPPEFIPVAQVPPFEGAEAWFELQKLHTKPWSTWKVLRQVEKPGYVA